MNLRTAAVTGIAGDVKTDDNLLVSEAFDLPPNIKSRHPLLRRLGPIEVQAAHFGVLTAIQPCLIIIEFIMAIHLPPPDSGALPQAGQSELILSTPNSAYCF